MKEHLIKKNIMRRFLLSFVLCVYCFTAYAGPVSNLKIAAGVVSGTYYPVALQMCKFISKYSPVTKCEVVATSGSINNLNLLATEKVDFAFVQSDVARDAVKANGIFAGQKPYSDLRIVMNLFPEVFSMLVRDEKGVVNFSDISGMRIGVNLKGSGAKSGLMVLFNYFKFAKDPQVIHVPDAQMPAKLCEDEVDAVVLFTGHPSGIVSKITSTCDVEFISVDQFKLENIVAENPVYEKSLLGARSYTGISRNATSFATRAILVANSDLDSDKVNLLRSIISKNLDEFKKLYPVLNNLNKIDMFDGVITSYPK